MKSFKFISALHGFKERSTKCSFLSSIIIVWSLLLSAITMDVVGQGNNNKLKIPADKTELLAKYNNAAQPLLFMENRGQITDQEGKLRNDVLFMAKSKGFKVAVKGNGLSYQFEKRDGDVAMSDRRKIELDPTKMDDAASELETYRVDMTLVGANPNPQVERLKKNDYTESFYNLPHAPEGILGVAAYEKIVVKEVYPGIDWVIYTHEGSMKYDFVVRPGADPSQIQMKYAGAQTMTLQNDGSLKVVTPLGEITEEAPLTFSDKKEVDSRFVLKNGILSFEVPSYDASQDLTIDPSLIWGTYYGGISGSESGGYTAVDASGNVYLSGTTSSATSIASGGHQNTIGGGSDVFLVKFNTSGTRLWATYYGGTGTERYSSVAVDASGNVYLAGETSSTTGIASGGHQNTIGGGRDAFLVKFNTSGTRQWGTYYGGTGLDGPPIGRSCVAVDASGNVYLSGQTSSNTGIASGGHQNVFGGGSLDAFLVKFNTSGTRQWGTYYGGTASDQCSDVAVDASGNVYLTGSTDSFNGISTLGGSVQDIDAYLVKFNTSGVRQWGRYYGGAGVEEGYAVATDALGNVYLTGETGSNTDIASGGHQNVFAGGFTDAFLIKFNTSGTRLWGTYYGGTGQDEGFALAVDASGNVYLGGLTRSTTAIASGGFQNTYGGENDGFVAKFNASGVREWGSYYGGAGSENVISLEVAGSDNIYISGTTSSTTGIASGGHQNTITSGLNAAFLAKIFGSGPSISGVVTNSTCGNNGAINITVTGGTAPYTYNWGGGVTSEDRTNLAAGTYTVTVTDAALATASATFTVTGPNPISGTISSQTNVLCFGQSTGSVTVVGSGGTAPYSYSINGGSTYQASGTFTGRPAGAYTVIVRDANLCTVNVSGTITQPVAFTVAPVITQPSCFAFGAISLTVTGGTAPYTYDWSDVVGTNDPANRTGLAAGTYSVVVTDANGCTVSSGNITLNAASNCAPTLVCKSVTPFVFSVDPDPNITTYTWTVPSGAVIVSGQGTRQISVNWNGVTSGTYQVCVSASNVCGTTAQTCLDVNVVDAPVPNATASPACVGSNVQLFASGGTTYAWTGPGGFSSSIANPIIPNVTTANNGNYTVVVTNSAGCTASQTVSVTVSTPPSITGTISPTSCGTPVGAVNITVTPAGTYTYAWSNGATTEDLSGLVPGVYSVTVTNSATGCTAVSSFSINAVPGPVPTGTPNNITCFGGNNGSVTGVSVTGGVAGYTYLWSGPGGFSATTPNISGLTSGIYNLRVTDATGCQGAFSATITQPTALNINFSQVNVNCFGASTGSITLNVSGGTGAYSYAWLRNGSAFGGNTSSLTGLIAATYQVTVTDANNCTAVRTIVLTGPAAALSATSQVTNISCFGSANGQITLTPSGGTAPYSYAWSRSGGGYSATTKDVSNLTAGTYSVTITDAKGCTFAVNNIAITQPTALSVGTSSIVNVSCFGGNNGSITATATGGTSPYTYQWSNGATTSSITGLVAGNYTVTVTDALGCTVSSSVIQITQPTVLAVSATPTAVTCFGSSTGSVTTNVTGGTSGFTYLWSNGATTASLSNVAAGNYSVTVTDSRGCTALTSVTVGSPVAVAVNGMVTNVLCNGASTGAINITATGGVGSLTYDWADIAGTSNAEDRTGLPAGTYSVTVRDANGCTATRSFTVTQPVLITASFVNTNILCVGSSNGAINLTVNGGVGPYTYLWSNGATTQDLTGLAAGAYSVTVTDANSCSRVFSAPNIVNPVALSLAVTLNKNVNCFSGTDGGATAVPTGGTAPYTYQWSDGGTGAVRNNLIAGSNTVTVTDASGCTAVGSVSVSQPLDLTAFGEVTNTNGCGRPASGAIRLTVQGGTTNYGYAWSGPGGFTSTTKDISNLAAGTYTVTVTDNNGCTEQLSRQVLTEVSTLAISIAKINQSCTGFPSNNNGQATVLPTGGIAGYTYLWSNGATTQSISNLAPGNYSVTVTDAGGCTATSSTTINSATCALPVAVNDVYRQCDAAPINGNVATNDNIQGIPVSQMRFELLGLPSPEEGTLVWGSTFDGTFTFTPNPTFAGTVVIEYIVEDPNGLSDDGQIIITISRLDLLLAGAQVVNATCTTRGSITIPSPSSGGTAPYEYSLNNVDFQSSNVFNNLAAGSYTVYVRDANNCTGNAPVTVGSDCTGVPDLTPTIDLPSNTFNPDQIRNLVLVIEEVKNIATASGVATFGLVAPIGYELLPYDGNLLTMAPDGGLNRPVNNLEFSVLSSNPQQIVFRAKPGVSISALGIKQIGLKLKRTTALSESVSNITVNINTDSTLSYDSNNDNNIFFRILNAQ